MLVFGSDVDMGFFLDKKPRSAVDRGLCVPLAGWAVRDAEALERLRMADPVWKSLL